MIDEVESKHLQLLISRAFHATIGKKCLHYNIGTTPKKGVQLERGLRHNYIESIISKMS